MTAEPENDPPLPEEAEEETQEQQGESLFAAPVMAEQERMIEAILFATADPVSVKELNARMPHGCDAAEALVHLRKRYEGRGVRLVKVGDDWAMRTAPDLGFLMQKETVETRKLSRAAIETLAIIAYKQPTTRAEVEAIRGVSVSHAFEQLQEKRFIKVSGIADSPGRPKLYRTTEDFLLQFGMGSLKELPTLEELQEMR